MKAWAQIGALFCVLLMSGCRVGHDVRLDSAPPGAAVYLVPKVDLERDPSSKMVVHDVRLDSVPPGAAVYLVPKVDLERDPSIKDDQCKLAKYRVPEGDTPVVTTAREQVYIVRFVRDGQVEMRELDVLPPPHKNQAKAVFP